MQTYLDTIRSSCYKLATPCITERSSADSLVLNRYECGRDNIHCYYLGGNSSVSSMRREARRDEPKASE
jgi:hypothetical protein